MPCVAARDWASCCWWAVRRCVLFPLGWLLRRAGRGRQRGARRGLSHVPRRARDERPALLGHVPALLQGRAAARVRRRFRPGAARALSVCGVRGAARARCLGGRGHRQRLGTHAGSAHPADVPAGRLALREAGLRRARGAFGQTGRYASARSSGACSSFTATRPGPTPGRARSTRARKSRRRASSTPRSRSRTGSSL